MTAGKTTMRYIWLALAIWLVGCGGAEFAGGDPGIGIGGAAGDENPGTAGVPSAGGGMATGGAISADGSPSAGGNAAQDCTAPLPTTFTFTRTTACREYTSGVSPACASDPCWSATLTWDPTSITYDEARSIVNISVSFHSSGEIPVDMTACGGPKCSLLVPDFTFVAALQVTKVSNGYQIMHTDADWSPFIARGYCATIPVTLGDFELDLNAAWYEMLQGDSGPTIVLPCITAS